MTAGGDRDEVARRMRARGCDANAGVLLNQRVVSGIGNVLKSEILFLTGIDRFTPVATLTDDDLGRLVDISRDQLAAKRARSIQEAETATGRCATRSLDPNAKLWVYGRGVKPCRRCGAINQSKKTGVDARLAYWCPHCQTQCPGDQGARRSGVSNPPANHHGRDDQK